MATGRDLPVGDYLDAALERALMEEYLSEQGRTFADLALLDGDDCRRLMLEAAAYAALRLCERAYS